MKRTFRYLWQSLSFNLLVLLGLAAVLTVGAVLSGAGTEDVGRNPFGTYFGMFPFMSILILFILSFNLCTVDLQIAVSFGARRRDFFLGLQGALLAYSVSVWGLQSVMSRVPEIMGWSDLEHWQMLLGNGMGFGEYLLMIMAILAMGCLCGLLYTRSKVWSVVVLLLVVVIGIVAVFFQMMTALQHDSRIWGDLPMILRIGFGVVLAVAEAGLWNFIKEYCVR